MFPDDADVKAVQEAMFDPFEYFVLRDKDGLLKKDFVRALGKVSYQIPCHSRVQNMGQKTRELLEAGVHFGHHTRRCNPKMKRFIFGERNGIYIIDLQKTQRMFREAITFVANLIAEDKGKTVLFVGTKRQAQDAIREESEKCGQYYVNQRWLGGLLTNFQTVQKSIKRLKDLEAMQTDGRYEKLTKKERIKLDRETDRGSGRCARHHDLGLRTRQHPAPGGDGDRARGPRLLGARRSRVRGARV